MLPAKVLLPHETFTLYGIDEASRRVQTEYLKIGMREGRLEIRNRAGDMCHDEHTRLEIGLEMCAIMNTQDSLRQGSSRQDADTPLP